MLGGAIEPEIHELIEQKDFATLKSALSEMEVHDLTELVESLAGEDLAMAFRLLPLDRASEVFGDLPYEKQEELYSTLSSDKFAAIFGELPPDERTEFLEELPGQVVQHLLTTLSGHELQIARELMAYPEGSIGRLMTPEYVAVRPHMAVEDVFREIRRVAARKETFNVVYVVDDSWKLLDEISLEQLVLAEPQAHVRDLMDEQVGALHATDDRETAVESFKKYDALVLPVVNSRDVLVGIVTVDDVLEVAEEESTEDFLKMAAVSPLEQSYFGTSYFGMMKKRLPWLIMLLLAETIAVATLFRFEKWMVVLAMFMPLINATAGNTGNQVAGLMIRGLAVLEIELRDWWRVMIRELGHGMIMGVVLAMVSVGIVFAFAGHEGGSPGEKAVAVALAMTIAVALANVLGAMLPFFFKRIGVDPAVTSGPFIACVMDVASIFLFFFVATMILTSVG